MRPFETENAKTTSDKKKFDENFRIFLFFFNLFFKSDRQKENGNIDDFPLFIFFC